MRLEDKVAIVVGGGQTPGETVGNGRASAIVFAREGAKVLIVDRDPASAQDTLVAIEAVGGQASCATADVTREADCEAVIAACLERYGRIDVLHNNVGIGGGDAGPVHLTEEAWSHIFDVNLKGTFLSCKHVLPVMREQGSGSIINISSVAAVCSVGIVAYKTSKAGVNALTHAIAMGNGLIGTVTKASKTPRRPTSSRQAWTLRRWVEVPTTRGMPASARRSRKAGTPGSGSRPLRFTAAR